MVFDLQFFCQYYPALLVYLLQVLVRKTVVGILLVRLAFSGSNPRLRSSCASDGLLSQEETLCVFCQSKHWNV